MVSYPQCWYESINFLISQQSVYGFAFSSGSGTVCASSLQLLFLLCAVVMSCKSQTLTFVHKNRAIQVWVRFLVDTDAPCCLVGSNCFHSLGFSVSFFRAWVVMATLVLAEESKAYRLVPFVRVGRTPLIGCGTCRPCLTAWRRRATQLSLSGIG